VGDGLHPAFRDVRLVPPAMSTTRAVLLPGIILCAHAHGHSLRAQSGDKPPAPATIVRSPGSLIASQVTGLRIAVRDVDAPDLAIGQTYIIIFHPDTAAGRPQRRVSSDDHGLVASIGLDSGEYIVRVLRVGYREARFTIRVRPNCEQILEIYLSRSTVQFDRCQIRTAGSPPCDPDPPPTPSRATFTTCAPAG